MRISNYISGNNKGFISFIYESTISPLNPKRNIVFERTYQKLIVNPKLNRIIECYSICYKISGRKDIQYS